MFDETQLGFLLSTSITVRRLEWRLRHSASCPNAAWLCGLLLHGGKAVVFPEETRPHAGSGVGVDVQLNVLLVGVLHTSVSQPTQWEWFTL